MTDRYVFVCSQSSVGILEALVRSNATYEEMRNASISVCYVLVPGEGWDPDTLCSLAIDTYAPHVCIQRTLTYYLLSVRNSAVQ
jgi:hypothetical protein